MPTEDAEMDVTLYCERCGAIRRFCVNGQLVPESPESREMASREP